MRRFFTLFAAGIFTVAALPVFACSCLTITHFCESVGPGQAIAYGVVVEKDASGSWWMNVAVLDWTSAGASAPDTITIRGGSGADCLVVLAHFSVGDTVVLAPTASSPDWDPGFETPYPLYVLYECARTFLMVKNGRVTGPIREGLSEQPYAAFKADLAGCIFESSRPIRSFPNPATEGFTILNPSGLLPDRMRFVNALGQEVTLAVQMTAGQTSMWVTTTGLPAGVYFAVLDFGYVRRTLKWVKV
jgi:hypothetical protein